MKLAGICLRSVGVNTPVQLLYGYEKEHKQQPMLARMWGKRNTYTVGRNVN
jgi:hypothetical protein